MASKTNSVSLVMLIFLMHWGGSTAQSGCTTALISLSPCLNYVGGNSSTPSSSCCSQLSSVVQSQPQCLCALINGGSSNFGFAINQTLAMALPGACNVQTPPVSQCNGPTASSPTPASSPSNSPAAETPEVSSTPSDQDSPSGTGSKTVPTTDGGAVGGSNMGAKFSFVGTVLLIASSWAFSGF